MTVERARWFAKLAITAARSALTRGDRHAFEVNYERADAALVQLGDALLEKERRK